MNRTRTVDSRRDLVFDATRGICVFIMAVHHCINYFPGYSLLFWRFVSGAFPFLAGYLSTSLIREQYMSKEGEGLIGQRLVIRGAKLLAICLGLNFSIRIFLPEMTKLGGDTLFRAIELIFYFGDYKSVSFSLLIPIGYVLCFSGVLYMIRSNRFIILMAVTCLVGLYCSFIHFATETGYYLCYVAIGLLGMLCGFAHKRLVGELKKVKWMALVLWLLSIILISQFGQPFPIYVFYVVVSVAICYIISIWVKKYENLFSVAARHGQYSLLLYILQITLLVFSKILEKSIGYAFGIIGFWLALCMVLVIQWAIAGGVHYFRRKNKGIDVLYRIFFA